MAGRGGARPGAGRKKGSLNKLSTEAARVAAATGMLPHEILMRLGRGEVVPGFEAPEAEGKGKAKDGVVRGVSLSVEQRIECLKAAAPYYAPRLLAAAVKQMPADWNPYAELMQSVKPSRGLPFKPQLTVVK